MAHKLWKIYGPGSVTLAVFQSWSQYSQLSSLAAAGDKYLEIRGRKMGEKMYAMFGPMSTVFECLLAWTKVVMYARTEAAASREGQVHARAKAAEYMWKCNGLASLTRSVFFEFRAVAREFRHDNALNCTIKAAEAARSAGFAEGARAAKEGLKQTRRKRSTASNRRSTVNVKTRSSRKLSTCCSKMAC